MSEAPVPNAPPINLMPSDIFYNANSVTLVEPLIPVANNAVSNADAKLPRYRVTNSFYFLYIVVDVVILSLVLASTMDSLTKVTGSNCTANLDGNTEFVYYLNIARGLCQHEHPSILLRGDNDDNIQSCNLWSNSNFWNEFDTFVNDNSNLDANMSTLASFANKCYWKLSLGLVIICCINVVTIRLFSLYGYFRRNAHFVSRYSVKGNLISYVINLGIIVGAYFLFIESIRGNFTDASQWKVYYQCDDVTITQMNGYYCIHALFGMLFIIIVGGPLCCCVCCAGSPLSILYTFEDELVLREYPTIQLVEYNKHRNWFHYTKEVLNKPKNYYKQLDITV